MDENQKRNDMDLEILWRWYERFVSDEGNTTNHAGDIKSFVAFYHWLKKQPTLRKDNG